MSEEFKPSRMLQIYGQSIWHADARLCGTVEGLTALRDALSAAINSSQPQGIGFFPSDGEGYWLEVKPMSEDELDREPVWYTSDMANPDRFEHQLAVQRRVFELQDALRKVRIHNRSSEQQAS